MLRCTPEQAPVILERLFNLAIDKFPKDVLPTIRQNRNYTRLLIVFFYK